MKWCQLTRSLGIVAVSRSFQIARGAQSVTRDWVTWILAEAAAGVRREQDLIDV
jgi:hypothetical protein